MACNFASRTLLCSSDAFCSDVRRGSGSESKFLSPVSVQGCCQWKQREAASNCTTSVCRRDCGAGISRRLGYGFRRRNGSEFGQTLCERRSRVNFWRWRRQSPLVVATSAGNNSLVSSSVQVSSDRNEASSVRVIVDNESHEKFTVISVETSNRVGILQRITSTLNDLGLHILEASADLAGATVKENFYVTDTRGEKISEAEDVRNVETVLKVLHEIEMEQAWDVPSGRTSVARKRTATKLSEAELYNKSRLLFRLMDQYVFSIQKSIMDHVEYTIARSRFKVDDFEAYMNGGSLFERIGNSVKKGVMCTALAAAVALPQFPMPPAVVASPDPAYSELGVLISGPPIKDANALLRYALPISNKPIKEIQRTLEGVTDALKLPGVKAIDPVERDVRQALRLFSQNKVAILSDVAESKKEEAQKAMDKFSESLVDFQNVLAQKDRAGILPKQKECLEYVGDIEEAMVEKFPFEVPAEYAKMPLLKGRAKVEMKVRVKDNPNLKNAVFEMTVDGYNAPVSAGNFIDLVERRFYDNMEIQRADGFVVQTGDPDGPAEGFVDPETGKLRTIPLEIMVEGDKEPIYGGTLEELGRFREQTKLPFNAFGTLAMAREEFEPDSASSQIFWLLKESELTPSNANILDGTYSVFGYVTENQDFLADLKVGDVIESMRVTSGLDNLVNPSYKVGGA